MAGKDQKDMQIVLPPELWKEILLKLWQSEDDLEHLLTCRKVCRSWEELVDTMPPNLYWNPWFSDPERLYPQNYAFKFHPATSFTQDLDVTEFLKVLPAPGSADAGNNPFRNQTVRLFRYRSPPNDVNNEEENLLMILREHGHRVRKLVWNPHDELPERLMNLPLLLSGLTNLRTLIIDSSRLSGVNKKIIRGEDFPKELKHLRELVFRCPYISSDVDPDCTLYGKLSVNYGQQIKSITFNGFLDLEISKKNVLDCYPNLEDLKVIPLDIGWGNPKQPSGNPWPKLQRMALRPCDEEGSVVFRNVLTLVCCFSETLELLSLQFERSKEKIDGQNGNNEPAVFPKLQKLILPFSTVYNGSLRQPITIPIERRLNFGFPALRSVILEDVENTFGYRGALRNVDPIDICETLWPFVPSSVETISVRNTWGWNMGIKRQVVKIYKCSRNPIV